MKYTKFRLQKKEQTREILKKDIYMGIVLIRVRKNGGPALIYRRGVISNFENVCHMRVGLI